MNKIVVTIISIIIILLIYGSFKLGVASVNDNILELTQCQSNYMHCEKDMYGYQYIYDNMEKYGLSGYHNITGGIK